MADFLSLDEMVEEAAIEYRTVSFGKGTVRLGSLPLDELILYWNSTEKNEKVDLLVRSLVDAEGNRLVNPQDSEALTKEIQRFTKLDSKKISPAIAAAMELNGIGRSLRRDIKNVSSETRPSVSPIDSPPELVTST